ncbi:hypothetical protein R3P38DRAFT_3595024 [Favolaschia claudopus]|uniref:Uncharacterized protein n=1 Tax=Favolaschia claudopus TaxID=2862362 RepID=A0AAW0DI61_9AGAR
MGTWEAAVWVQKLVADSAAIFVWTSRSCRRQSGSTWQLGVLLAPPTYLVEPLGRNEIHLLSRGHLESTSASFQNFDFDGALLVLNSKTAYHLEHNTNRIAVVKNASWWFKQKSCLRAEHVDDGVDIGRRMAQHGPYSYKSTHAWINFSAVPYYVLNYFQGVAMHLTRASRRTLGQALSAFPSQLAHGVLKDSSLMIITAVPAIYGESTVSRHWLPSSVDGDCRLSTAIDSWVDSPLPLVARWSSLTMRLNKGLIFSEQVILTILRNWSPFNRRNPKRNPGYHITEQLTVGVVLSWRLRCCKSQFELANARSAFAERILGRLSNYRNPVYE